jgi:hypothetical protein
LDDTRDFSESSDDSDDDGDDMSPEGVGGSRGPPALVSADGTSARRRAAVGALLVALLLKPTLTREAHIKNYYWYDVIVPQMTDHRFRRAFRVRRSVAHLLLGELTRLPAFQQHQNSNDTWVAPPKQLLMALYAMGCHTSYQQLSEIFGVSVGLAHASVNRVVQSTVQHCGRFIADMWPRTPEKRAAAARAFEEKRGMKNCIGAIDCTVVKISPTVGMDRRGWYCSRKGMYGMVAQASQSWLWRIVTRELRA